MSEVTVRKTPLARVDLAGCFASIGDRNLEAAYRFRDAAEATLLALAHSPGIGELYDIDNPRLEGLRCSRVRKFRNHLIFYRPVEGGIEVIRVLHAARDIRSVLQDM